MSRMNFQHSLLNSHVCGLVICRSELLGRNAVNRRTAMRGVTGVRHAIETQLGQALAEGFQQL